MTECQLTSCPTADERFAAIVADIEAHKMLFVEGDAAMKVLAAGLAQNNAATKRVDESTAAMVEFFNTMQAAFKVLDWIGKLAKPIGAIVGLFTALWAAWAIWRGGK